MYRSRIAVAGHPLHPLLVPLPIGLMVGTFAADLAYLISDKDKMWYDIAFWAGIGGIVTALVAALGGLGDLVTMAVHTPARTIALWHMVLNVTTVALFFVAMLLMLDEGAIAGGRLSVVVILHAVGVSLLSVSGWLGGEMVFQHGLGVLPEAGQHKTT